MTTRFCKDCRWCVGEEYRKCKAPQNPTQTNQVDGSIEYKNTYCVVHRETESPDVCGREGRWFELKTD